MYVDRIRHQYSDGTIYVQYLLRTSRREGKKTIKTTILNITSWGADVCEAISVPIGAAQNEFDTIIVSRMYWNGIVNRWKIFRDFLSSDLSR
jgi:hypothetical protein